ncbi:unnamed protein product [Cercospora beticola]|nr:unnamed protein product [Cercospora beticola]
MFRWIKTLGKEKAAMLRDIKVELLDYFDFDSEVELKRAEDVGRKQLEKSLKKLAQFGVKVDQKGLLLIISRYHRNIYRPPWE